MVIGITGGIGSGKTAFARELHKCLDDSLLLLTDEIAKSQQQVGEKSWEEIVKHFGTKILNEDQTINSNALGEIVLQDENVLQLLNSITHPNVIEFVKEQRDKNKDKILLVESALLFDCELKDICDFTILVRTSDGRRKKWLQENRGYSMDKINQFFSNQRTFIGIANLEIANNGTLEDLYKSCENVAQMLENFSRYGTNFKG